MSTKIFVNLPVKDLDVEAFFGNLGFALNQQVRDETAACMVISDDIFAMLLTHPKSSSSPAARSPTHTKRVTCLRRNSREKVDQMVETAIKSGGASTGIRRTWLYV